MSDSDKINDRTVRREKKTNNFPSMNSFSRHCVCILHAMNGAVNGEVSIVHSTKWRPQYKQSEKCVCTIYTKTIKLLRINLSVYDISLMQLFTLHCFARNQCVFLWATLGSVCVKERVY